MSHPDKKNRRFTSDFSILSDNDLYTCRSIITLYISLASWSRKNHTVDVRLTLFLFSYLITLIDFFLNQLHQLTVRYISYLKFESIKYVYLPPIVISFAIIELQFLKHHIIIISKICVYGFIIRNRDYVLHHSY
jgi:hypothetical protein